jgi:hypothetical protein
MEVTERCRETCGSRYLTWKADHIDQFEFRLNIWDADPADPLTWNKNKKWRSRALPVPDAQIWNTTPFKGLHQQLKHELG